MGAFPGTHTRESKLPRDWLLHAGNFRSTDPNCVRDSGLLDPHIHTSPRPSVLLCRSPESSRNLYHQPLDGKGISILKSVVLKSRSATFATSQPSGFPLPFPVPSKVFWRHKQRGRTSPASSPQRPRTPYWLRLRHTPHPQEHTWAHTHSAHVNTHSARRPRNRPPTPAAWPQQAYPPAPGYIQSTHPKIDFPVHPQVGDPAQHPPTEHRQTLHPRSDAIPLTRGSLASSSSVKTLSLVDFITTSVSRTGGARLATISTHLSSCGLLAVTLAPAPSVPMSRLQPAQTHQGWCALGSSARGRGAQPDHLLSLALSPRSLGPLLAQQPSLCSSCPSLADRWCQTETLAKLLRLEQNWIRRKPLQAPQTRVGGGASVGWFACHP